MASSVVETLTVYGIKDEQAVLSLLCTDAASASFDDYDLSGTAMMFLNSGGYRLWKVQTIYGATGPTDNTDMTLKDADGVDILGAAGTDKIDNATINEFHPVIGTTATTQAVTSQLTLGIDHQAVNDAVFTINLFFSRG